AYYYRLDPKQWQAGKPYPPLGSLYAAGLVRSLGFETRVFDAGLAGSELDFLHRLERERPAFVVLQEDGFNYLTKMCLERMREAALQMVRLARACGARVAVCSSDATDFPEPYLRAGAAVVIRGESEATLADVLTAWRDERAWVDIAGLAYLDEDRVVRSPARAPITELDRLPAPAWDLVDLGPYREIWQRRHGRFSLNVATTRGCPYACNWCAKPLYGKRYTVRSPEQVVDEMQMLVRQHSAEHFWITDDLFGLKPGWVQRFAALVSERGLDLRYTIQTRADLVLRSADDLQAMARSGLETAWVGAESGSQRVLDAMDKGITREQIDGAVQALKQQGVKPALFLQFGYLGETAEDIRLTQQMVAQLLPDDIGISVSYPLPGTVFHDRVKAQMGSKTHWLHSNDLDLMFPGTFSPAFYRHLHAYTARRFQVLRSWAVLCGEALPRRRGRLRALASLLRAVPALLRARIGMWREQRAPASAAAVVST
ncbi:radical SAM protein, partial [Pelomonas sp. HMWF004]